MGDGRIVHKAVAGSLQTGYSLDVLKQPNSPKGALRFCGAEMCAQSTRLLSVGVWYHVTAVFEKKKEGLKFYINGKYDSSHTPKTTCKSNNLGLLFGKASYGGGAWRGYHPNTIFDGLLDDVSIWKIPLSGQIIKDIMFTRLEGTEEGLVGYWGFNEGQGNIVKDISPNHNNGYIVGNAPWLKSLTKPLNDPSNVERGTWDIFKIRQKKKLESSWNLRIQVEKKIKRQVGESICFFSNVIVAVQPLIFYMSWVQTGVSQVSFYP